MPHTDDSFSIALELADIARGFLSGGRDKFGATQFKEDGTPVTPADIECERKMRTLLEQKAPGDAVWGEELGKGEGDRLWVLDPIDGTKAFASGSPLFCSLIGLLEHGKPTVGVIEVPAIGRRWAGAPGQGFFDALDGRKDLAGKASKNTDLAVASIATTRPPKHDGAQSLIDSCGIVRYGGDAFNFACVADGSLDIALDVNMQPHDYVAVLPVIAASGALACDFSGNQPDPSKGSDLVAAGNRELLDKALSVINSA